MVSSGRSSSAARACDRDMHVVMLHICEGNKSSELWWSEKGNCLVEIISKLLILFFLFLSFLTVCFSITVVQILELNWLAFWLDCENFCISVVVRNSVWVWLWEFLCGFGCESFCMNVVVRISVWVWVVGISVCCGCGDFPFEFSSGNFCEVSLQVSSQKMRCRVVTSGSWLLLFVKV
jgi:hypothetical protein